MKKIILICLFLNFSVLIFAQTDDFKVYSETDSLKIEYKWTYSKPFDKTSPLTLDVKLTNKLNFCIKGEIEVIFYDKEVIKSSNDKIVFCIPEKDYIRGRKHKLAFMSSDIPNEFYSSEDFKFVIEIDELKKASKCK